MPGNESFSTRKFDELLAFLSEVDRNENPRKIRSIPPISALLPRFSSLYTHKDIILLSFARRVGNTAQRVGRKTPKPVARSQTQFSPRYSIPRSSFVLSHPSFIRHTHKICYSTADKPQEEPPVLQLTDSLRKLYLKVHPDFFSQWPEVQVRHPSFLVLAKPIPPMLTD